MKNLSLLALISAFAFYSCQQEPINYVLLSGTVTNPNADTISIFQDEILIKTFHLDSANTFSDTVYVEKGRYRIDDGTETTTVYFEPGFSIDFYLDCKEFDESIKYSGVGSEENNFLAAQLLFEESLGNIMYYGYTCKLDEQSFLNRLDSVYQLKTYFINKHPNLKPDFIQKVKDIYLLDKLNEISTYPSTRRYFEDELFEVSDNYPDVSDLIGLNNVRFSQYPEYVSLVDNYLGDQYQLYRENDTTIKFVSFFVESVDTLNNYLKEEVLYSYCRTFLKTEENPKVLYEAFTEVATDSAKIQEIRTIYQKLQKITKGNIAPDFEFYDIDSNLVKLSDFRGSFVLVDCWATWCAPCIKEMGYLEGMIEHFQGENIKFVSINCLDDKSRWEIVITNNNLQGIHLFADNMENEFMTAFMVTGVPRFIMINTDGTIITHNFTSPSDKEAKREIERLLKEND